MDENIKLYSEMERYEILNISDGNKFGYLGNNDVVFDDEGNLKLMVLSDFKPKFGLFGKSEFIEVSWDYIKRIGPQTIIIDAEEKNLRRSR